MTQPGQRSAKEIFVKPIEGGIAGAFIRKTHYSGKSIRNSNLHFGVFLDKRLEGAIQLGPSIDKKKMLGLVSGTGWSDFIELNRLAFTEYLPRNSESRALARVIRVIKKRYPWIKWLVTYADACQSGDGTIYRALGFLLTDIKKNRELFRLPNGEIVHAMHGHTRGNREAYNVPGAIPLSGFQLRYILFLDPSWRERLAVPVLPYSQIKAMGAEMYLGNKINAGTSREAPASKPDEGGSNPTSPLRSVVNALRGIAGT